MASPLPAQVVIECPHCGMRYQLPPDAIGPKGREVACAHCGKTWKAKAKPILPPDDGDKMFDEAQETALDQAMEAEERAVAPVAAPVAAKEAAADETRTIAEIKSTIAPKKKPVEVQEDPAGDKKRQKEFDRRQVVRSRQSPLAKVRRLVRLGAVTALIGIVVCGIAFRTEIVKQFPDLAGAYETVGLGVNVIGLEFRDVRTLTMLRNGSRTMQVDARIFSVAGQTISVPPVVVTLLDEAGTSLYEWSVIPEAKKLSPGEVSDFATTLSAPPLAAARVRLTFTDGKGRTVTPVTQTATPSL